MAKIDTSITLDKQTLEMIDTVVESHRFRNRSHAIEFIVRSELMKKEGDNNAKKADSRKLNQSI